MRGLLFPGQGSQSVGMAQDLYERFDAARETIDRADEVLGFSLSRLMFSGPPEQLQETRHAQPAILTHSIAVWRSLEMADPTSRDWVAAGHSLGEYSAYVAAGALAFEDAVGLVHRRGELMFAAGQARPGTMAAVLGSDPDTVRDVCAATAGTVVPANLNSPGQLVISGEEAAVAAAGETLRARGAKRVIPLRVSGAFHSPLMEPAVEGLRAALAEVTIQPAGFPVYANASAAAVVEPEAIRQSLLDQLRQPVLWEPTVRELGALEPEEFWEVGPGQVLKGLVRAIDRTWTCRPLGTADEVTAFNAER